MFSPLKRSLLAARYKINSKQNNTFIANNRQNYAFSDQSLSKNTLEQKDVNKKKYTNFDFVDFLILFFHRELKGNYSEVSQPKLVAIEDNQTAWKCSGIGQRLRKSFPSRKFVDCLNLELQFVIWREKWNLAKSWITIEWQ